jgi:hypothetical protein
MKTKDHKGCVRAFYHLSEAWYAEANRSSEYTDDVTFGMFAIEGGTTGEMAVRWQELGGKSVPQLRVFDDGWSALATFTDLIVELGKFDDRNITPKDFCALLIRLGFEDQTPRQNPYGGPNKPKRETVLENTLSALVDAVCEDPDSNEVDMHIKNAKKLLGRK